MNAEPLVSSLARFAAVLPAVVAGVGPDDACWRGPGGTWSILEIVRHLLDEEVEDFRTRLRLTLTEPETEWPPIDPEGWAVQRRYNESDLVQVTQRFVDERRESLVWLRELVNPDWSLARVHPKLGTLRAGDLLAAWAAHDLLHLRQLAKRRHQLIQRDAGSYSADYAGAWPGD